jgi:hypothetical protein
MKVRGSYLQLLVAKSPGNVPSSTSYRNLTRTHFGLHPQSIPGIPFFLYIYSSHIAAICFHIRTVILRFLRHLHYHSDPPFRASL